MAKRRARKPKRKYRSFSSEGLAATQIIGAWDDPDGLGDWVLWHIIDRCESSSRPECWHNFALECPAGVVEKSVYRGGWNGERLSKTHDMGLLQEHRLQVYQKLLETCELAEWSHYA